MMDNTDVEFSINFTQQQAFKESYFRNNRACGQKNIRCFPLCASEHVEKHFCGQPLRVLVNMLVKRSNPEFQGIDDIRLIAEFKVLDEEYGVITSMNGNDLTSMIKTKFAPTEKFFLGKITERSPPIPSPDGRGTIHRCIVDFNSECKGWHYAWFGSRFKTDVAHVISVTILGVDRSNGAEANYLLANPTPPGVADAANVQAIMFRPVAHFDSPSFTIASLRRKTPGEGGESSTMMAATLAGIKTATSGTAQLPAPFGLISTLTSQASCSSFLSASSSSGLTSPLSTDPGSSSSSSLVKGVSIPTNAAVIGPFANAPPSSPSFFESATSSDTVLPSISTLSGAQNTSRAECDSTSRPVETGDLGLVSSAHHVSVVPSAVPERPPATFVDRSSMPLTEAALKTDFSSLQQKTGRENGLPPSQLTGSSQCSIDASQFSSTALLSSFPPTNLPTALSPPLSQTIKRDASTSQIGPSYFLPLVPQQQFHYFPLQLQNQQFPVQRQQTLDPQLFMNPLILSTPIVSVVEKPSEHFADVLGLPWDTYSNFNYDCTAAMTFVQRMAAGERLEDREGVFSRCDMDTLPADLMDFPSSSAIDAANALIERLGVIVKVEEINTTTESVASDVDVDSASQQLNSPVVTKKQQRQFHSALRELGEQEESVRSGVKRSSPVITDLTSEIQEKEEEEKGVGSGRVTRGSSKKKRLSSVVSSVTPCEIEESSMLDDGGEKGKEGEEVSMRPLLMGTTPIVLSSQSTEQNVDTALIEQTRTIMHDSTGAMSFLTLVADFVCSGKYAAQQQQRAEKLSAVAESSHQVASYPYADPSQQFGFGHHHLQAPDQLQHLQSSSSFSSSANPKRLQKCPHCGEPKKGHKCLVSFPGLGMQPPQMSFPSAYHYPHQQQYPMYSSSSYAPPGGMMMMSAAPATGYGYGAMPYYHMGGGYYR